ncbi:MAG TPA: signal recognition particle-docking protein FtsY [Pseudogracilibacillus sp.]|nr:signal recognition particle-docking protein FtsY [Pseudogracilibacillus sp.]
MSFFNKLKNKFMKQETDEDEELQGEETAEEIDVAPETYKKGMEKTRSSWTERFNDLIARYRQVDEDFFEELEEALIMADVGVNTVMDFVDVLRFEVQRRNIKNTNEMQEVISEKLVDLYYDGDDRSIDQINYQKDDLTVILVVGVNGVGKTTSIGKMANQLKNEGKKVVLAAGDTFRAGAIEQLEEWGSRADVDVVKQSSGSDPAAVIFDAIRAAKSREADVLICDTAGRLQNKVNLMNELNKIHRIIEREVPHAPHEVLLVLDATTGQNALSQAKTFSEVANVSGIVLTKLDGTAKGGIVLAIRHELDIPVKMVGFGEQINDLQQFDAEAFVYGLFADALES